MMILMYTIGNKRIEDEIYLMLTSNQGNDDIDDIMNKEDLTLKLKSKSTKLTLKRGWSHPNLKAVILNTHSKTLKVLGTKPMLKKSKSCSDLSIRANTKPTFKKDRSHPNLKALILNTHSKTLEVLGTKPMLKKSKSCSDISKNLQLGGSTSRAKLTKDLRDSKKKLDEWIRLKKLWRWRWKFLKKPWDNTRFDTKKLPSILEEPKITTSFEKKQTKTSLEDELKSFSKHEKIKGEKGTFFEKKGYLTSKEFLGVTKKKKSSEGKPQSLSPLTDKSNTVDDQEKVTSWNNLKESNWMFKDKELGTLPSLDIVQLIRGYDLNSRWTINRSLIDRLPSILLNFLDRVFAIDFKKLNFKI